MPLSVGVVGTTLIETVVFLDHVRRRILQAGVLDNVYFVLQVGR